MLPTQYCLAEPMCQTRVRAFRNERRESWFAGVERAFRHFGRVTEEVLLAEQMTIRLARDHGFADSPLEEASLERTRL